MTDEDVMEPLLNVEEVCAWLNVKRDWVYDAVQAGRLPHLRIGGRQLRFRRSELEGFLRQNSGGPKVEEER